MKRILLYLLEGGLLLAGLLLAFAGWRQDLALQRPLVVDAERLIEVPAGATPGGMLNRLESEGVLDGAFWLRLFWRFNLYGKGCTVASTACCRGRPGATCSSCGAAAKWCNTA